MSILLCFHMNIIFLLLCFHFAIGLLEKSDLDVVANELDAVSTNWYTLGQHIGLDSNDELDPIHTQYSDNRSCLREMISYWLQHHYATWSSVVASVRSSGGSQLANHLHSKYCPSELTVLHSNEINIWCS